MAGGAHSGSGRLAANARAARSGTHSALPAGIAAGDALLGRLALLAVALERSRDRSDIENVHKLRTTLRRVRAAMRAYAPLFPAQEWAVLREQTAALFRVTSPVRDADVQTAFLDSLLAVAPPPATPGLVALRDDLGAGTEVQWKAALRALDTFDADATIRRLAEWGAWAKALGALEPPEPAEVTADLVDALRAPAERLAARAIRRAVRRTQRHLEPPPVSPTETGLAPARMSDLRDEDSHALRIDVKKLRYTCELFGPVLGDGVAHSVLGDLTFVQDHLGEVHDADVLDADLQARLDGLAPGTPEAAGLCYLLARTEARRDVERELLDATWTPAAFGARLDALAHDVRGAAGRTGVPAKRNRNRKRKQATR